MNFDYYYGSEVEQFSFYRIPKLLIKDERFRNLSNDAKLLYGCMIDRLSLSQRNHWIDKENKVYIYYKLEHIIEDLNCSKGKASKVLAELDCKKGVGLIERKRQGLGRPDRIYVKNFVSAKEPFDDSINLSDDTGNIDYSKFDDEEPYYEEHDDTDTNIDVKNEQLYNNESYEMTPNSTQKYRNCPLEYQNLDTNNTEYNKNEFNNINLINRSDNDMIDDDVIDTIKNNIEYDFYMQNAKRSVKERYREFFSIICDVVCIKRQTVRVGGENYPYQLVRNSFLSLTSGHLDYVMECMKKVSTRIRNIKSYIITALYNATQTMDNYYAQEVISDGMVGSVATHSY